MPKWKIYGGNIHRPTTPEGRTFNKIGSTILDTIERQEEIIERIVRKITKPVPLTSMGSDVNGGVFSIHLDVDWFTGGDILTDGDEIIRVLNEPKSAGSFFEYEVDRILDIQRSTLEKIMSKLIVGIRECNYDRYLDQIKPDGWSWQEWYDSLSMRNHIWKEF